MNKQYQAFVSVNGCDFQTTKWFNEDELDELYKLIGKLVVKRSTGKGIGVRCRATEQRVVVHTVWDDLADDE